jgi:hypothetical protein
MTRQEIFDKAFLGVIAQGKKSARYNAQGQYIGCRYRGPDGLKCAIGMLVDDETATHWDIFGGVHDVAKEFVLAGDPLPEWMTEENMEFLELIQSAHDDPTGDFVHGFILRMKSVAKHFGLSVPEIPAPTNT